MIALVLLAALATPQECQHSGPLYWEIGDANGTLEYGFHGSSANAETTMQAGFATSWLFAAYMAQTRKLTSEDKDAIRMVSGFAEMSRKACLGETTVGGCMSRAGGLAEQNKGHFLYNGAHLQHWAATHGFARDNAAQLGRKMGKALRVPLEMIVPEPASGAVVSATGYGAFLRKLLKHQLKLSAFLGKDQVGGEKDTVYSPAPAEWHYSYGHFVEDDGAFSSPGSSGFYPWIKGKYYGIVARRSSSRQAFMESVDCGRALRRDFEAAQK